MNPVVAIDLAADRLDLERRIQRLEELFPTKSVASLAPATPTTKLTTTTPLSASTALVAPSAAAAASAAASTSLSSPMPTALTMEEEARIHNKLDQCIEVLREMRMGMTSLSSSLSSTTPPPSTAAISTTVSSTTAPPPPTPAAPTSTATAREPLQALPTRCSTLSRTHGECTLAPETVVPVPSSTSSRTLAAPTSLHPAPAAAPHSTPAQVVMDAEKDVFTIPAHKVFDALPHPRPAVLPSTPARAGRGTEENIGTTTPTKCSANCQSSDNMLKLENSLNICYSFEKMQHRYITNFNFPSLFDVVLPPLATTVLAVQTVNEGMGVQKPVFATFADKEPRPYILKFEQNDISPKPPWPGVYLEPDRAKGKFNSQSCFSLWLWFNHVWSARQLRPPWPPPKQQQRQSDDIQLKPTTFDLCKVVHSGRTLLRSGCSFQLVELYPVDRRLFHGGGESLFIAMHWLSSVPVLLNRHMQSVDAKLRPTSWPPFDCYSESKFWVHFINCEISQLMGGSSYSVGMLPSYYVAILLKFTVTCYWIKGDITWQIPLGVQQRYAQLDTVTVPCIHDLLHWVCHSLKYGVLKSLPPDWGCNSHGRAGVTEFMCHCDLDTIVDQMLLPVIRWLFQCRVAEGTYLLHFLPATRAELQILIIWLCQRGSHLPISCSAVQGYSIFWNRNSYRVFMLRILATTEPSWAPTIHFKRLSGSIFQQNPIPALLLYQQLNHGCATDMALNMSTMAENARQLKCGSTLSWECSLNGKPDLLLHVSNIARLLGGDYLQVFKMAMLVNGEPSAISFYCTLPVKLRSFSLMTMEVSLPLVLQWSAYEDAVTYVHVASIRIPPSQTGTFVGHYLWLTQICISPGCVWCNEAMVVTQEAHLPRMLLTSAGMCTINLWHHIAILELPSFWEIWTAKCYWRQWEIPWFISTNLNWKDVLVPCSKQVLLPCFLCRIHAMLQGSDSEYETVFRCMHAVMWLKFLHQYTILLLLTENILMHTRNQLLMEGQAQLKRGETLWTLSYFNIEIVTAAMPFGKIGAVMVMVHWMAISQYQVFNKSHHYTTICHWYEEFLHYSTRRHSILVRYAWADTPSELPKVQQKLRLYDLGHLKLQFYHQAIDDP